MARTKGTWGTVREVPRKGSGRFQASYVHGGVWGVQKGVRFTAPQTFDTRGDAWAWLDREHRLIDRDDWTPPLDRLREDEAERERAERVRRLADQTPTIAEYGTYRVTGNEVRLAYANGETETLTLEDGGLNDGRTTMYPVKPLPDGSVIEEWQLYRGKNSL